MSHSQPPSSDFCINKLHDLWNPEAQFHILKDCPIILTLILIDPHPRSDIYFFKIHYNIVLASTPRRS